MSKVYLIPGLGADSRLFKNIILPDGYDVVRVDWLIPKPDDTLTSYAQTLIDKNHIGYGAIVIGVSLGGIIAVEMAKKVNLAKVILISSIKTDSEAPWYFRLFRGVPVYKAIPGKVMTNVGILIRPVFGEMHNDDLQLFKSMLGKSSPIFIKWAMWAVLHWRNSVKIPNLYHIIGDKDLVFPYRNIMQPTAIIKGGTHIMVFDRANEINKILAGILQ